MAGHSKFKNIQHRKGTQDKKRSARFAKLSKEITVAVKLGSNDIASNPRLRSAINEAKSYNMPKDNIEKAVNKGLSNNDDGHYEDIRYEGYGPHGVAVIVEALTDNKNRTASEVRSLFTKSGGSLGETGSVAFLFDRVGRIVFAKYDIDYDTMLTYVIEANGEDLMEDEVNNEYHIIASSESLHKVADTLAHRLNIDYINANLIWYPKVKADINQIDDANSVLRFLDLLDDLDDVQRIYANYQLHDDIINELQDN